MAEPMEPGPFSSAAQLAQLQAEARDELRAMLVPSGVGALLIFAIGIWRGPGALWPLWGTIGTTIVIALVLGVWAAFIRDWRILRTDRRGSVTDSDTRGHVPSSRDQLMPRYLLHHQHLSGECGAVFASFSGHDSPLRHKPAMSSCLFGGHAIWWEVTADSADAALGLLPFYVAQRTTVVPIAPVDIP